MTVRRPYRYALFDGVLESEIELPELPLAPDGPTPPSAPVVTVRLGPIPAMPEGTEAVGRFTQISPGHMLLSMPYNGRFLIRDNREIIVEPEGSERNAPPVLYGACLAIIATGRGMLPVHASALETPAGTFMFCGHSGAGKSTLAAAFANRGHTLVADDLCHLVTAPGQPVSVWPIMQQVRLWRRSADALGWSGRPSTPVIARLDKFIYPGQQPAWRQPLPVSGLFLLDSRDEDCAPAIEPLAGIAAVEALLSNLFLRFLLPAIGREQATVGQTVAVARQLPVCRLTYPRRFDRLESVLALVDDWIGAARGPVSARPRPDPTGSGQATG